MATDVSSIIANSGYTDALGTLQSTTTLLNNIQQSLLTSLPTIGAVSDLVLSDAAVPAIAAPTLGGACGGFTVPPAPDIPILPPLSTGIGVPAPPTLTEPPPALLFPDQPLPFDGVVPDHPLMADYAPPTEPTYTLPVLPDEHAISLPNPPVIDLPLFSAEAPIAPPEDVPLPEWEEVLYDSALIQQMKDKLIAFVADRTTTGVTTAVTDTIWGRSLDRATALSERWSIRALRNFACRGQPVHAFALAELTDGAGDIYDSERNRVARDRVINDAELAQTNFKFSLAAALELETTLIDATNGMRERAMRFQLQLAQITVDIFNSVVRLFNVKSKLYAIEAEVYTARLDALRLEAELYKAEIEAQTMISDLNLARVKRYTVLVEGITELTKLYRARLEAVKALQEREQIVIEGYRADVEAYAAQVKAKAYEFDGYDTAIKAEAAKLEAFDASAKAYDAQVATYKALSEAAIAEKELLLKVDVEAPIAVYEATVKGITYSVDAQAKALQACLAHLSADGEQSKSIIQTQAANRSAQADLEKTRLIGESALKKAEAGELSIDAQTTIALLQEAVQSTIVMAQLAAQKIAAKISQHQTTVSDSCIETQHTSVGAVNFTQTVDMGDAAIASSPTFACSE